MSTEKQDTYQRVTDLIVQAIEQGAGAYKMPWHTTGGIADSPINAVSRKPYRGINVLVLWAAAQERGYSSGTWATYKQWGELGAQVRKGEKSTSVVFWRFFDCRKEGEKDVPATGQEGDGDESETPSRRIPMAREYCVFNAGQVDGYAVPEAHSATPVEERIATAEGFFRSLGVRVLPGGNSAFYRPETDSVHMPAFDAFPEPMHYYSVLGHESTHWSGAPDRLNRDLSGRFGSDGYAMEELVAELGAAFLCAELGLPTDPRKDHAPYVANWLKVLKGDKRAIFTATAKAQAAVDWMQERAGVGTEAQAA